MLLALLLIVADACPRVRETHYLLPTTSNGFGNQYYAIEKAAYGRRSSPARTTT